MGTVQGAEPRRFGGMTSCARRFLAHVGRAPTAVTTEDVEGFLLDLVRPAHPAKRLSQDPLLRTDGLGQRQHQAGIVRQLLPPSRAPPEMRGAP